MITTPSQQTRTQTTIPLLAICLGYFMTILDVTIVNVALVDIKEHLSANVTGLQWIVDGYSLVFASFLLTGGALGDRKGRRTVFLAGLALFTLASTLCSLAPTLLVLQIARAFQGLGAALLVPNSLALLQTTFPDAQKRAWAIGIWAAVASVGALSGPLLGGVLVNTLGGGASSSSICPSASSAFCSPTGMWLHRLHREDAALIFRGKWQVYSPWDC